MSHAATGTLIEMYISFH